jgi:hypothetical protein
MQEKNAGKKNFVNPIFLLAFLREEIKLNIRWLVGTSHDEPLSIGENLRC